MTCPLISRLGISVLLVPASAALAVGPAPTTQPSRDAYRTFAMVHQGDAAAGKALFLEPGKIACSQCHTIDGKGGKVGPDLFAMI